MTALKKSFGITGFTLVELLVVMTIMGAVATVVLVNSNSSNQEKNLSLASADVQSMIRVAQANALSGTICDGEASRRWMVEFKPDKSTIELQCLKSISETVAVEKSLTLEKVQIGSITGGSDCPLTSFPLYPLTLQFFSISGKLKFLSADPINSCVAESDNLSISLEEKKSGQTKSFTVSSGGAVNAK